MKKTAFIILTVLILLGIGFAPYWDKFYKFLDKDSLNGKYSQLSFKSLRGEYEVFIDDKKVGDVKDKEQKNFIQIEPGVRKVRIIRATSVKDFFYTLERNIEFLESSQVEVEWEAGPTLESSSGTIKYFTKIVKADGSQVYVLPFPQNAEVSFDSRQAQSNTFDVYDSATHTLRVAAGEGFEPKLIELNLIDQNSKKVLKDLKLVIEVYLYKLPFK